MVNNNPRPDERVVYLALKNVFKGQNAEVRQRKVISKLIRQHRQQEDVADIVREHNFDVICNSAHTLLCDEIFASTLKAKIRFPELFDLSPTQSAEREASEAEAARHEADAIEQAVQGRCTDVELVAPGPNDDKGLKEAPPLFPVYLPLEAQHKVLVHLQSLLEHACYDYGKRVMPEILRSRRWDCSEAVELNRWTDEFTKRPQSFAANRGVKKPLDKLLRSIANIRHTAVHRIRVSVKTIEQFLLDADALLILLVDLNYTEKLKKLRQHTIATIEELQRNKQFLRSRLDDTLRDIAAQRDELKRLEEVAITKMEEEDIEYQLLASKSIGEAIAPSEASFSTAIETERGTLSRLVETSEIDENEDNADEADDDWDLKASDTEEGI